MNWVFGSPYSGDSLKLLLCDYTECQNVACGSLEAEALCSSSFVEFIIIIQPLSNPMSHPGYNYTYSPCSHMPRGDVDLGLSLFPLMWSLCSSVGGVRLCSQSFIMEDIVFLKWLGVSLSRAGHCISSRFEGVES